jgi:hypothetical protein
MGASPLLNEPTVKCHLTVELRPSKVLLRMIACLDVAANSRILRECGRILQE